MVIVTGGNSGIGYEEGPTFNHKSYDEVLAKRLWAVSEELTGVIYNFEK